MVFAQKNTCFTPGVQWNDADGKQINAHGGCIVFYENNYYWFGEDRTGSVSNGVSCYQSSDLYNWKRLGLALKTEGEPKADMNDISHGRLFERPKVVYNAETKKWVMWIHWESGNGYGEARVCVATSDKVEGPYVFYKTFRPNQHDSRDQTLFKDIDGKVYHFSSVDMNTNMNIALLRDDYLEPSPTETKILNGEKCEAPTIFRVGATYFGLFSGCTGWTPNAGRMAYTRNLLGVWKYDGSVNFAIDPDKDITYKSQSAYVFKVEGKENAYIYVGDRWNPQNVGGSHTVWLPVDMRSGYPTVKWYDTWDLSVFDEMYRYKRAKQVISGNTYLLLEKYSNRLVSKPANGFTIADDDTINLNIEFIEAGTSNVYKLKDTKTGKFIDSVFGSLRLNMESNTDSQQWMFEVQEDGYYTIQNKKDLKCFTVSGSGTFNGTNLYLSEKSNKLRQDFAVYFDSKKYDYAVASIF
jgi:hypothetical protein